MNKAIALKIKALQWQCRRGMLEIDIFLKRYLSNSYEKASPEEQAIFEAFLTENDQEIFFWLTGQQEVLPQYRGLVEKMKALK